MDNPPDDIGVEAQHAPAIAARLGGGPLAVIETHAARVLVGRSHALKIKRPVRYDYLDFTTQEARRAAGAREIDLNRPHAPEIYLGLVRITREPDGTLSLDGTGPALEHAVLMRRFEQADVLSARLTSAPLPDSLAKALGDMVARYHADAARAADTDEPARMAGLVADIGRGLAAEAAILGATATAAWLARAEAARVAAAPLLAARASGGYVRRCHGDLHSGNVVLWRGAPLAFDALEFDERLATIDTLYDLAFLIMDLDARGHRREARIALDRYLWRSGRTEDLDGLAALPLFLSLRAAIRAMVGAQKCELEDGTPRARDAATARAYLDAAASYLAAGGPPRLVAIGGLSGTGKSTLGADLAVLVGRAPGALHLRSDVERKAMFGVEETDRLPAASYTRASSDAVYARLLERAGHALAAGHSVILDAVWLTAAEQDAARTLAVRQGARFDGLWLDAPLAVLHARVAARRGDASDATPDVVTRQAAAAANPAGWPIVDASGDPAATLRAARAQLGC